MRHHLPADFGKTGQPVRNGQEPVFIQEGNIACHVPPVMHDPGRQVGTVQVALHDVGPLDEQHACRSDPERFKRIGVDDADGHAR